jgi:hypothetical protein
MEVSTTQLLYAVAAVAVLVLIYFVSTQSFLFGALVAVGAAAAGATVATRFGAGAVTGGDDDDQDWFGGGRKRAAPVPDPNWKPQSGAEWDRLAAAYTAGYAGAPMGAAEFVANGVLVAAGARPAHRIPAPAPAREGRTARPAIDEKLAGALAGTGLTLALAGDGSGLLQRADAKKPLPAATSAETEAGRAALGYLEPAASGEKVRTLLWRVEDLSREHMRPRTFLVECVTAATSDAAIEKRRAAFAKALAPHPVTVKILEPGSARPARGGTGAADNVGCVGGYVDDMFEDDATGGDEVYEFVEC